MRYVLALIVLACLGGDAVAACRTPVRNVLAGVRTRVVHRERHVVRERARVFPLFARPMAATCGPQGCPVPTAPAPAIHTKEKK